MNPKGSSFGFHVRVSVLWQQALATALAPLAATLHLAGHQHEEAQSVLPLRGLLTCTDAGVEGDGVWLHRWGLAMTGRTTARAARAAGFHGAVQTAWFHGRVLFGSTASGPSSVNGRIPQTWRSAHLNNLGTLITLDLVGISGCLAYSSMVFFVYKAGGWHLNSFDLPVRHFRRVRCERKKDWIKERMKGA